MCRSLAKVKLAKNNRGKEAKRFNQLSHKQQLPIMGMMCIISKCNVKIDVFSHVDHVPLMAMAISSDHELFFKKS